MCEQRDMGAAGRHSYLRWRSLSRGADGDFRGPLTPVTRLDEKADEKSHRFPRFLPDGKGFLTQRFSGFARLYL